jgi:hypothetical protein
MPLPGMPANSEPAPASAESLPKRLHSATRPDMVQIAPNKYVPHRKGAQPPAVSLCSWTPNADGSYSPIPFTDRLVRLDNKVGALLGFAGHQRTTLRRLGMAGFIDIVMLTPKCTLINIDSYFNHLRRCSEDPDGFWDREGKNYKTYIKGVRDER